MYMFCQFAKNTMLKALFLHIIIMQMSHQNNSKNNCIPYKVYFILNNPTYFIKQYYIIILSETFNHPEQNNSYLIIPKKLILMIVILRITGASSLYPIYQFISFIQNISFGFRNYRPTCEPSHSLN